MVTRDDKVLFLRWHCSFDFILNSKDFRGYFTNILKRTGVRAIDILTDIFEIHATFRGIFPV